MITYKQGLRRMQNQILRDDYIACPFQIQMCDLQGGISLGSGFFYEVDGETFVITNWHNVTGKNHLTGASLHKERSPTHIKAKWPVIQEHILHPSGAAVFRLEAQTIQIEDDHGPLWLEHPDHGSTFDVVAIPFEKPPEWPQAAHVPANKIDPTPIPLRPGLKVVVIGFPQGLSTGPGIPVIKSGFLSSEPGFEVRLGGTFSDVGGMMGGVRIAAVLLDVHTVPGMSGSPVFGEYTGFWDPKNLNNHQITDTSTFGTSRMFLGCYSSRVSGLEERSGLGLCFESKTIEEICRLKHPGSRFAKLGSDTGFTYT